MAWHRVAEPDALEDGAVRPVDAAGRALALTRVGSRYGALDARCPHMGGSLAEGEIAYGFLACPWHGREFNPLTGECEGYAEHVESFPVDVREDGIYVELPD